MRTEILFILLVVSVETSFPFITLKKIKLWYAIPFSYCVLSCMLNTGLWRAIGLALVTAAARLREEVEQVSGKSQRENKL
jgi:hypothetical protein